MRWPRSLRSASLRTRVAIASAASAAAVVAGFTILTSVVLANNDAAQLDRRLDSIVDASINPYELQDPRRGVLTTGRSESTGQVMFQRGLQLPPLPLGTATVEVNGVEYPLDAIVSATGFAAMTGSFDKMAITGRKGRTLADKWRAGPRAYLGIASAGFPNLFLITGPGSPSVLASMIQAIEQHVDWLADCMGHMRDVGATCIETITRHMLPETAVAPRSALPLRSPARIQCPPGDSPGRC